MSVILTAAKRKVAKSAKPKKKRPSAVPRQPSNSTPPVSTERTAVWHWIMDKMTTTVIFTKETSEVWCNGVVLDTIDSFSDDDAGSLIDFCIFIEETQTPHKARICRTFEDEVTHHLYVDGYSIYPYMGQDDLQEIPSVHSSDFHGEVYSPEEYASMQCQYSDEAAPGYAYGGGQSSNDQFPPAPPTYEEAIGYQN